MDSEINWCGLVKFIKWWWRGASYRGSQASEARIDLLDFCVDYLKTSDKGAKDNWVDEDKLQVSLPFSDRLYGVKLTSSAGTVCQLEGQRFDCRWAEEPEVTAAREWLEEEETNDLEKLPGARDVLATIRACLKDSKRLKTTHSIKVFTWLTAVVEYYELWEKYYRHPKCTCPCLNASHEIVRCMGKDAYFACQIQQHEEYLAKHGHLHLSK